MKSKNECEQVFYEMKPFWHLCTPGDLSGIIFRDRDDYVFGMNAVALCAAEYAEHLHIFTFQIMSNHFHFVVSAEFEAVNSFFNSLTMRLGRYFSSKYGESGIKVLKHNVLPVSDLKYLRNLTVYVNRNGYVVNRTETPFSYRWGANGYFYNSLINNGLKIPLSECSIAFKRKLFRSRNFFCPANYYLTDGYVSPLCYCQISLAEKLFTDAHQYFNYISRQVEAFSDLAKELGDRVILTDDEMYSTIVLICRREYNVEQPVQLVKDAKLRIARLMHYDYNASNKQIKRILKLDDYIIDSLFPQSSNK